MERLRCERKGLNEHSVEAVRVEEKSSKRGKVTDEDFLLWSPAFAADKG